MRKFIAWMMAVMMALAFLTPSLLYALHGAHDGCTCSLCAALEECRNASRFCMQAEFATYMWQTARNIDCTPNQSALLLCLTPIDTHVRINS